VNAPDPPDNPVAPAPSPPPLAPARETTVAPARETTVFTKPKTPTPRIKKKGVPQGLWTKCKGCNEMAFDKDLEANLEVCPKCGFHFPMSAPARLASLLEKGSFQETDAGLSSVDTLKFTGVASYSERLKTYQKQTGLNDAIITGIGKLDRHRVALGVMEFAFLGASMGSVVGEKVTRIIERATAQKIPLILISASGGARMYEGMLSLMQMAKTSGALARHAQARLPYISVLTHPTTAGVMASYASLGDVIIAEPGALIGFAGPRVIKETTQQELPRGFQTAEFLLDHGLLDMIVARKHLKATLSKLLDYLCVKTACR
jgi:acetyl-CoA carboxylase carboxyl transferase subunit beta